MYIICIHARYDNIKHKVYSIYHNHAYARLRYFCSYLFHVYLNLYTFIARIHTYPREYVPKLIFYINMKC